MFTSEALQLLLFLIPGFVVAGILNILVVRKEKKELETIVEALIFSLLIYTAHSLVSGKSPVILREVKGTIIYSYDKESLLWLTGLSVLTPLALGLFVTNDLHMKLARWLKITHKTARHSVWFDVFSDVNKHIVINFENGRRIYGWPTYYSDEGNEPYVFLYRPAWIVGDRFIDLDEEGILITPVQKIESIEFMND